MDGWLLTAIVATVLMSWLMVIACFAVATSILLLAAAS